jgi:hypothetical protein
LESELNNNSSLRESKLGAFHQYTVSKVAEQRGIGCTRQDKNAWNEPKKSIEASLSAERTETPFTFDNRMKVETTVIHQSFFFSHLSNPQILRYWLLSG